MPFGEIVCGSPGSGKSTYCYGKHQLCTALARPIHIVNLDPANDALPYPCAVDIAALITLKDVMDEHGLGPNGALLYCMEYLEANFDWLEERLRALRGDAYVLFDLPGQVELSTNHDSVPRVVEMLGKRCGFRLAAVHLCDAHYVTDAAKYISVLLLSLRTMLHLELPHVNVLSKIDLLAQYGHLDFTLPFYTEVHDLSYLAPALAASSPPRFAALNMAMISLIEDFSLVGFETLAVEDKPSMLHLTHAIDRATGYVFVPRAPASASASSHSSPGVAPTTHPNGAFTRPNDNAPPGTVNTNPPDAATSPNAHALFSTAFGPLPAAQGGTHYDVRDVQERWLDAREEWDAFERVGWRREAEAARARAARERFNIRERRPPEGF
ncbi:cytoplasmic protein [Mycena haematopus]|nr:cytoplasmic protein [Mycena haematopus]